MKTISSQFETLKPIVVRTITAVAFLACLIAVPGFGNNSDARAEVAQLTDTPPLMDGRLLEDSWKKAKPSEPFHVLGSGRPAKTQTAFRTLANAESLYIGVECQEENMNSLVSQARSRDGSVFLDDSIEVIFDPSNERRSVFHLAVNAHGSCYDSSATVRNGGMEEDAKWNGAWEVVTATNDNSWSVEIKVPLSEFQITTPASVALNVCRNRPRDKTEFSSWSPCSMRFMELWKLRQLQIPGPSGQYAVIQLGAADPITGASLPPFLVQNAFGVSKSFLVESDIVLPNGSTNTLRSSLGANSHLTTGTLPETGTLQEGQYLWRTRLVDNATSRAVSTDARQYTVHKPVEIVLNLSALYEKKIAGQIAIRHRPGLLRGSTLKLRLCGEDTSEPLVTSELSLEPELKETPFSFDLSKYPEGCYRVEASVAGRREAVGSDVSSIFSYSPRPRVGISSEGFLDVEGKPFFPIGMYTLQDTGDSHDAVLSDARQAGFNTTVFYAYEVSTVTPLLDAAARNGIKAFVYVSNPYKIRTGHMQREELLRDIQSRTTHPALLGWYLVDEPEGIGESAPETIRSLYETVKSVDPHHPGSLVIMTGDAAKQYGRFCDVLWIDPYPVPDKPVTWVSECIQEARKAVGDKKPVWGILQAFDWNVWRNGAIDKEHRPTAAEERCMTYLALVHGAKGVIYWAYTSSKYRMREYPEHWTTMKGLAGELRTLTPVLLTSDVSQDITTNPEEAPVDTMIKKLGNSTYLFAVNHETTPTTVTFQAKTKVSLANVEFENRTCPILNGKWTDKFDSLAVHVYRLSGSEP